MKHIILFSLLIFVNFGVFGQSLSAPPQKITFEHFQSSFFTLQDSIRNLQADNADLHNQLDNLEKEIERYHEDVKIKTSTSETHISWWLVITSIIITLVITVVAGGLGVIVPLLINRRSEKNALIAQVQVKHAKLQATKAQQTLDEVEKNAAKTQGQVEAAQLAADDANDKLTKAQQALSDAQASAAQAQAEAKVAKADADKVKQVETNVKQLERNIVNIQTSITKTAEDAKNGFKKAKAVQYFIQALQEKDDMNRAIDLYTLCIIEDKDFAEAYNNRGFLRHKIGDPSAMEDYTSAIFKKSDFAEALNNRGIMYLEENDKDKARDDFDSAISLNYAEAYLNRGLLNYQEMNWNQARRDFNEAIDKKRIFAEAYYIRGLFLYYYGKKAAINGIIRAKEFKPNVVEELSTRNFLTGKMKELDNAIYGVEYSKDMIKLISVPNSKSDSFIIPNFVNEIGNRAFYGCKALTSIEIPDSVTKIEEHAFSGCTALTSIEIPISVTKIGEHAFSDCSALTSIEIHEGVTEIGNSAFYGCTSITSIVIPDSMTKIGNSAFANCTRLDEIIVNEKNTNYCSKDGVLYSKDKKTLIAVPNGKTSIKISDSVTEISAGAFFGCKSITSIEIPNSVSKIGDSAFAGCRNLFSIIIPECVSRIGDWAFLACDLKEIHLKHKTPIDISRITSWNLYESEVKIIVPKGTGWAYRNSKVSIRQTPY